MPAPTRPADSAAVRRLAAELAGYGRRLSAVENAPQLAHSSLPVDGQDVTVPDMVKDAREAVVVAREAEEALAAARTELEAAQAELATRLSTAEGDLAAAEDRLTDAEAQVSQAITVAGQADAAAQAAGEAAATAQTTADAATSEAVAAQGAADAAAQAAADAAGIAAGKGKVVFGSSQPAAADRLATTLWIDTTSGANTPKRWSGSAWVAVTDKAAVDAAAAAAAAQGDATNAIAAAAAAQLKADQAHTLAGTAESNAQAAITAASGAQAAADAKPRMLFSTAAPSGTAPQGSVWFRVNASGQVIGQWQQTAASTTGSTWTVRELRSEVIANLDVGKLTAGSADIVTVVAQKIAASTAAFQTVDVNNLFVTGTSTVATQVAQAIWAAKITAQKILATEVLIGGPGANLLPDPMITTPAAYTRSAGVVQNPSGGRSGAGAFVVTSTAATQDWSTAATVVGGARPYLVAGQGGRRYIVEAAVRSSVAVAASSTALQLVRYFYDAAGTLLGSGTLNFDDAVPADTWTTVRAITPAAPAGTAYVRVGGRVNAAMTVGAIVEWSDPACFLAIDDALIVDGGILARHLNVVSTDAATGQMVSIQPDGLRLWASQDTGEPTVSLTTSGGQVISILDQADQVIAGIDPSGRVMGSTVIANDSLQYRGRELETYWADRPEGLLAIGGMGAVAGGNLLIAGNREMGLFDIPVLRIPNRWYKATVSLTTYPTAVAPEIQAFLRCSPLAQGVMVTSPQITNRRAGRAAATVWDTRTLVLWFRDTALTGVPAGQYARVLLSLYVNADTRVDATTTMTIETIGTGIPFTQTLNTGGATSPPPSSSKQTRTDVWSAVAHKSFINGGSAEYAGGAGPSADYAVQGDSPYVNYGQQTSQVYFNSAAIRAALSGSTVEAVSVYVKAVHWHSAAGGVARLHRHNNDASPGNSNGMVLIAEQHLARGEGRWIEISPSFGNELRDGVARGIGFAPSSGAAEQYGYFEPGATKIAVRYTK